ncbi:MAG TPA: TIGR02281 family clan AA aspartic protease [Pseudomonadales bacterium]|nr:TIGR02281 family clan AA aspartic protease [Pseudomonadales bacterium]
MKTWGCAVVVALLLIAPQAWAEEVKVLGVFNGAAMLEVDGKQKLLKPGQSSGDVKLISVDARQATLEVNGQARAVALGASLGGNYAPRQRETVRLARSNDGHYRVRATINGQLADMLVDTGATSVVMNSGAATKLGINYQLGREGQSLTASGVARAYFVTLSSVKVGEIDLTNVDAAVVVGPFPVQMLLGMSFLSRVQMAENNGVLELRSKY